QVDLVPVPLHLEAGRLYRVRVKLVRLLEQSSPQGRILVPCGGLEVHHLTLLDAVQVKGGLDLTVTGDRADGEPLLAQHTLVLLRLLLKRRMDRCAHTGTQPPTVRRIAPNPRQVES